MPGCGKITRHEGEGAECETGEDTVEHEHLAIGDKDDGEVLEDPT